LSHRLKTPLRARSCQGSKSTSGSSDSSKKNLIRPIAKREPPRGLNAAVATKGSQYRPACQDSQAYAQPGSDDVASRLPSGEATGPVVRRSVPPSPGSPASIRSASRTVAIGVPRENAPLLGQ